MQKLARCVGTARFLCQETLCHLTDAARIAAYRRAYRKMQYADGIASLWLAVLYERWI